MILLAAEEGLRSLFEAHEVSGDAFWTGAAAGAFRAIAPHKDALPQRTENSSTDPAGSTTRSLSRTNLEDYCQSSLREQRLKALESLSSLARDARGAETESSSRRAVAAALGCLADRDVEVRITAVGIVADLGAADDEEVTKALTKALGDWHRPIRASAAQGLVRLAKSPSGLSLEQRLSVVEAACSLLMDTRYQGRDLAIEMLPDLTSKEDPRFVQTLAKLLDSERTEVRDATVKALAGLSLDHEDPNFFEPILERFGSAFTYTRVSAGRAASLMMRPGKSMRLVAGRLADPDPHVRAVAVRACGNSVPTEVGPPMLELLSELLLHASSSSSASASSSSGLVWGPEARRGALFALGEMKYVSHATLTTISRSLADGDSSVRLTAITSLSQICRRCGPEIRLAALEIAQQALQDEDPLVQDAGELLIAQWEADPSLMQQIDAAEEECSVLSPGSVLTTTKHGFGDGSSVPVSPGNAASRAGSPTALEDGAGPAGELAEGAGGSRPASRAVSPTSGPSPGPLGGPPRPLSATSLARPDTERRTPSPEHPTPTGSSRPLSGGSAAATTAPASQRLRGFVAQIRSLRSLASNPRPGDNLTPLELADAGLEKLKGSDADDRAEGCKLLAKALEKASTRGPSRLEAVIEVTDNVFGELLAAMEDLAWPVREAAVGTSQTVLESLQRGLERAILTNAYEGQMGEKDQEEDGVGVDEGSKRPPGEVLFTLVRSVSELTKDSALQVRCRIAAFYLGLAQLNLGQFQLLDSDLESLMESAAGDLEYLVQDWTAKAADGALRALLLFLKNEQLEGVGSRRARRLHEAASFGLEHREERIRQLTLSSFFKRRKLISSDPSGGGGEEDWERGRVQNLSDFAGLRLEHFNEVVRSTAVDALEKLNCVEACAAAEARLNHAGAPVRSAALRVLERLARGGSGGDATPKRAVEGITKALGHDDASTRKRALELLEALSMPRRRLGLETLRLLLQSPADAHRSAAVLACNFTLEVEDLHTLELLVLCIERGGDQAPGLAVTCLSRFLPLSAPCLWEFIADRISHPEGSVRSACGNLLVGATERQPGSIVLVSSLLGPHLNHRDEQVREIAASSLRAVAVHGPSIVGKVLAELFASEQPATRDIAVEALADVAQIAGLGDQDLMHYVTIPLTSPADFTRKAAVQALGKVSQPGNSEALAKLLPLLDDPCPEVAWAASRSVVALKPPLPVRPAKSGKAAPEEEKEKEEEEEEEEEEAANTACTEANAATATATTTATITTDAAASQTRSQSSEYDRKQLLDDVTLCLPSCSSSSREVRLHTASLLEMVGTQAVRLALLACLEDASSDVREASKAALAACRPASSQGAPMTSDFEILHRAAQLMRHRSPAVRAAASDVLVSEGLARSLHSFSEAEPDELRRRAIAAACTVFESDNWDHRETALSALQKLVPRTLARPLEPISVLVKARNDEKWAVLSSTLFEVLRAYCDTGRDELPQLAGKVANGKVLVRGQHGRRYLKEYQDRRMLGLH